MNEIIFTGTNGLVVSDGNYISFSYKADEIEKFIFTPVNRLEDTEENRNILIEKAK